VSQAVPVVDVFFQAQYLDADDDVIC